MSGTAGTDTRRLGIWLGRVRGAIGVAFLVAPRSVGHLGLGVAAGGPDGRVYARTMGARELALGLGTAIATAERRGGAGWTSMGAVADGLDAAVLLLSRGLGWRARLVGVVAAASAVGHLVLARGIAAAEADASATMGR